MYQLKEPLQKYKRFLLKMERVGLHWNMTSKGILKISSSKSYLTIKNFRFVFQQKRREFIKLYGGRKRNGNTSGTVKDGDNKLNAFHGVSVRHGLKHRSHLSI